MFTANPFAELSASISPAIMQAYVVVMIVLVAGGTLVDVIHKKSATYFFANWRDSKRAARQQVGGKIVSLVAQSAVVDVLASGEFCNMKRRLAHLLGMYGFVFYVVATIAMVFWYPTPATPTPSYWPLLWWLAR